MPRYACRNGISNKLENTQSVANKLIFSDDKIDIKNKQMVVIGETSYQIAKTLNLQNCLASLAYLKPTFALINAKCFNLILTLCTSTVVVTM